MQNPGVDAGAKPLVINLIIGNNATAVAAAGKEAERLGYLVTTETATQSEGSAEEVGRQLAQRALKMPAGQGPTCLVSGGEPVVKLVDSARRGLGGRNQQLVLAALLQLAAEAHQTGLHRRVAGGLARRVLPTTRRASPPATRKRKML